MCPDRWWLENWWDSDFSIQKIFHKKNPQVLKMLKASTSLSIVVMAGFPKQVLLMKSELS